MQPFVAKSISLAPFAVGGATYSRADVVFDGVDHSGHSYALRVFFNNPAATEKTSLSAENGYAGSIYVFGHGGCFGDEGHCEVPTERRPFDLRPPHQLIPAKMWFEVTDALRQLPQRDERLVITVVPIVTGEAATDLPAPFQRVALVTYA
jgi:tyrosinase